jgi:hypothetical protein
VGVGSDAAGSAIPAVEGAHALLDPARALPLSEGQGRAILCGEV